MYVNKLDLLLYLLSLTLQKNGDASKVLNPMYEKIKKKGPAFKDGKLRDKYSNKYSKVSNLQFKFNSVISTVCSYWPEILGAVKSFDSKLTESFENSFEFFS